MKRALIFLLSIVLFSCSKSNNNPTPSTPTPPPPNPPGTYVVPKRVPGKFYSREHLSGGKMNCVVEFIMDPNGYIPVSSNYNLVKYGDKLQYPAYKIDNIPWSDTLLIYVDWHGGNGGVYSRDTVLVK